MQIVRGPLESLGTRATRDGGSTRSTAIPFLRAKAASVLKK